MDNEIKSDVHGKEGQENCLSYLLFWYILLLWLTEKQWMLELLVTQLHWYYVSAVYVYVRQDCCPLLLEQFELLNPAQRQLVGTTASHKEVGHWHSMHEGHKLFFIILLKCLKREKRLVCAHHVGKAVK